METLERPEETIRFPGGNTTRMTLRLPAELHSRLSELALINRISLNEMIVRAGERYVGDKWKPTIREMLEDIRVEEEEA